MIDSVNNQFLSYGMGRWQVAQGIMTGAEIILDATSLSLNTASAALAMSSFFSFFFLSFWALKDVGYTKANPNIATKTNNRCLFLMIAKFKCLIYSRFD